MTTVELVGIHADGDYLSSAELHNLLESFNGVGVFGYTFGATVTSGNRIVTLPAMTGRGKTGAGVLKSWSYAGGDLTHDAGDASPRVDLGVYDISAGTMQIVKGIATAETGDVAEAPTPAITSDQQIIYKVRIPANASVIAADTVKGRCVDIRNGGWATVYRNQAASAAFTGTAAAALLTASGLNILPSEWIRIRGNFRKTATAAQAVGIGLALNATTIREATVASAATCIARSTATQQAEDGEFEILIAPRSAATYVSGLRASMVSRVTATGAIGIAAVQTADTLTNPLPTAAITDVILRGINDTSNNNLEVFDVTIEVK